MKIRKFKGNRIRASDKSLVAYNLPISRKYTTLYAVH